MKFSVENPEVAQSGGGKYKAVNGLFDFVVDSIELITRTRENPKEGQTKHFVAMKLGLSGLTGDAQGVTVNHYFSFVGNSDKDGNLVKSVDKNGLEYFIHPNSDVYKLFLSMGVFAEKGSVKFEPKNYTGVVVAARVIPTAYAKSGQYKGNIDTDGLAALLSAVYEASGGEALTKDEFVKLVNDNGVDWLYKEIDAVNSALGLDGDSKIKLTSTPINFYLPRIDRDTKPYGYEEDAEGTVFRVWVNPSKMHKSNKSVAPSLDTLTPSGDDW